ncbi:hypothetical protein ASG52_11670 [Methylobacterium sp. Leaf456]|uniref:helix-turn-helix domain-containing protein n=1 Tax=Methylobacterium sp. Leaf456 TaxID=1736382 RepID=UPI0006FF6BD9|nr:helix-turn-helix transcriptional regulator [Methylobacterium sp. Leaf456]KQT47910.1 hypothetical protein ASG52_11670 [Methylobacterium sp. Leaf456]
MDELRKRFGLRVALHRRRKGMTQDDLASAADLSVDMISKIESGSSGARFGAIERLATALDVDPSELFLPPGGIGSRHPETLSGIAAKLALLSDAELGWVKDILDAILRPRA